MCEIYYRHLTRLFVGNSIEYKVYKHFSIGSFAWINLCTLNGENVTDEFVEEFADAAVISTVSSRLQEVRSPGAVPTVVSKSESEPRLRGDLRKPRGVSSLTSIILAISFS